MYKVSVVSVVPQEKLSSLVDSLCVEAVDKILTVVRAAAQTPGHLKDPPQSEQGGQGLTSSTEGELKTQKCLTEGAVSGLKEVMCSVFCVFQVEVEVSAPPQNRPTSWCTGSVTETIKQQSESG